MHFPKQIVETALNCFYFTTEKDNNDKLYPADKNKIKVEYGNEEDNTEFCVYINPDLQTIKGGKHDGQEELSYNQFDVSKFMEALTKDMNYSLDISFSYKESTTTMIFTIDSYNMLFINFMNSNQRIFYRDVK